MIVKKYTGSTETEAVVKAREELGNNAVVLNVKTMKHRGLGRLFKKDYVEITAAIEENEMAEKVKSRTEAIPAPKTEIDIRADEPVDFRDFLQEKPENKHEKSMEEINRIIQSQIDKDKLNTENEEKVPVSEPNVNFKSLRLIYNKLIENEVDDKYANMIISDIENSLKKESTLDSILASVYQKIILKIGEPKAISDSDKKKAVFFIGPTGVGKTTTIAKLASEYKINHKKNLALITCDTYRIAAVEQLNTYASILDVPVNVVYSPNEIIDSIKELQAYDLIFIDTAGRSHKNDEQRNEIDDMVNMVLSSDLDVEVDVHLVLSATTKYKDLIHITDAYSAIADKKLLFTKLDETSSLGNILNLRLYSDSPLSYTATGQTVPDDIEVADVQKLAKQLLGGCD